MRDASGSAASARALPVIQGLEHLGFRCTGCGNCCRSLRVTVTHEDLRRLVEATGEPCSQLVTWLAPDQVDMAGEPGSFVELAAGRRLMVLAQAEGACRWLDGDDRCRVYSARPYDCRLFPFHLESHPEGHPEDHPEGDGARSGLRLSVLSLTDCDHAHDGAVDSGSLVFDDRQRWRELSEYQALVARWNRLAAHRRRLRHRAGTADDFFAFLMSPQHQVGGAR